MPAYTPEPLPLSVDPVLSEYLHRELMRISNTFIGSDEDVAAIDYQPHDADLDAISVLVTQAYGRNFLTFVSEASFKASVNLEANIDFDPAVHLQSGKTTPVDADEMGIADSAASFVLKKVTWANIKATLVAAFNSVYARLGAANNFTLGQNVFVGGVTGNNGMATATGGLGEIEVRGNGTGAAIMSFHRPGVFATYVGLAIDNSFRIGGWSLGANSYRIWHEGIDGAGSGLDADLLDGLDSSSATAANTVAIRDVQGDLIARLHRTEWTGLGWNGTHLIGINSNGGVSTDNYMRPASALEVIAALIPTYGAVGSYIFGYIATATVIENGNYAGSSIQPASVFGGTIGNDANTNDIMTKGGSVLAGTWRALGRYNTAATTNGIITLFVRIA